MKKPLILALVGLLTLGLNTPFVPTAEAKPIPKRQHHQLKRIHQGAASGELTRREGKSLLSSQKRIQQQKKAFRADGDFTKRERANIQLRQQKQSGKIYRLKHNSRDRH